MRHRRILLVAAVGVAIAPAPAAQAAPELVAFPGAEGFGAGATGGRGGDVVFVDTLEPFGPGSLGDALDPEDCRPRIVVFRVGGVIEVPGKHDLELTCGDLTIAGQTAPGGITLNGRIDGYDADPAGNIIIRHLRLRPPPLSDEDGAEDDLGQIYDALQLSNNPNMILDHVSVAWGSDETLDVFEFASDVTIQWSTIEESNLEGQPDGPHNYGLIAGPDSPRVSIHHVLFAHHRSRCPALATGPAEFVNSVVYDCEDGFVHHNPAEGEFHIAGNTFIHGPSHENFTPLYFDDEEPGDTTYWLYQNDIRAPGQVEGVVDDIADTPLAENAFAGADPDQVIATGTDFATESEQYIPISMQSPEDAYDAVLAGAGAFPRDAITTRTVQDVVDGTGEWGAHEPADLADGLSSGDQPADEDDDGMADDWEAANGLDPGAADDDTVMESGYTAVEQYVNELSDELVGAPPPTETVTPPTAPADDATDEPSTVTPTEPASDDGDDGDRSDRDGATLAVAIVALCVAIAAAGMAGYALRLAARDRKRT